MSTNTQPIVFFGLVFLAALVGASAPGAAQPPSTPVRFTEVVNHEVSGAVRLPGTVESRTSSIVASEAEGLVIAVDVEEGDAVRQDQPLARLRTISYDLQLRAAQGELKEAEARLDLAQSKLRRARELFEDEIVSQDDLDDAISEFTAWQGRVDETTARIDALRVALDRCTIRAPFSGAVVRKLTDVGQWMAVGGEVFEMVALDRLDVRVEVPERYYRQINSRVVASVSIEALPGLEVNGKVEAIIPRADLQARTFPIKVRIANPERKIGVGMLARVTLLVGDRFDAILVPKDAVVRQGPQEMVYRIKEDRTVEPVQVTSGQGMGSWVVVEGPLAAGERVVTRGNERLFPGQPVQGEPLEYALP